MANIQKLSPELVNQIAAGEVIARPASVVKELVENALDAGATRIDVVIEDGGAKLISVTDNGSGMGINDLSLAFTPHATSKITKTDDLFNITTLGFRGEALASIASISHAQIRTRKPNETSGYEITSSGNATDEPKPCASSTGTTVTIRDLFFNTPARRKFMRKANTEFGHISEQVTRLALAQPQVAITLSHNGRSKFDLPAVNSTAARAKDLFGGPMAETLLPISSRPGPVQVKGLIGQPSAGRGSGKWQYFFLNGRFIRDRIVTHALREAYRGLIDSNRWPVAFVFIEMDPAEVDVNVHPTKVEVRFRDGQAIHSQLLAAMRDTLNKSALTPAAKIDSVSDIAPDDEKPAEMQRRESLTEALADFFKSASPTQSKLHFPPPATQQTSPAATSNPASAGQFVEKAISQPASYQPQPVLAQAASPTVEPAPQIPAVSSAVQMHNSYIVSAEADGIMIVDQHALHERIIYNQLAERLTSGGLTSQRLLIPETVTVTEIESDTIAENEAFFARMGIEVLPFGPQTVAIQRFPSLLTNRGVSASEFLREMLDELSQGPVSPEIMLEKTLSVMACKAAVKAGEKLTQAEIDDLLAHRTEVEKSSACPHGRPTTIMLTLKDLEKQFKRT